MSTPPPAELLWALLQQSFFVDSVAAAAGLRRVDMDSLLWLHLAGESTPGEVGAALGLSSGGTSGVLDRLEREGLVERTADAVDRRRVLIKLSAEGERLLDASFTPLGDALDEQLSPGDLALLDRLTVAMEAAATTARAAAPHRLEPTTAGEIDGDYSVALAGRRKCTATFSWRFSRLSVESLEPGSDRLFQARLGSGARVRVADDGVGFLGRRLPLGAAPQGSIALNPSLPWSFRIPGGAMTVEADLSRFTVDTVAITGGSNELSVVLGANPGSLRITGGANRVELQLDASLPVSLTSRGGMTRLEANGESRRLLGRGHWELPGREGVAPLEIFIRGGANTLVVVRR